MSLSSYDPADRYRRRAAQRTVGLFMFVFFIAATIGIGVWLGRMQSRQSLYIYQEQNTNLVKEQELMQEEVTALRAEAQTAQVRLEQLKASYEELLSEGAMQDLLELLRQQLEKGVDPNRLRSVILSARPPQNCSDPKSKRFVVITPVYNGPTSIASIGQGAVSISGIGASAQNAQGQAEAWFDPGQPIEVTFKGRGGEDHVKQSMLPMYHSVIVGDKEYRFTITEGAKSFAKVTYDYCDYP